MSYQQLIEKIDRLPMIPGAVTRLIELMSQPDADIDEIVSLIGTDASLTGNILRACNSPLYRFQGRIGSLQHALVMLGFVRVSRIIITLSALSCFRTDVKQFGLTGQGLWKHSVYTAFASRNCAEKYDKAKIHIAYAAGLLHDVGKVVMALVAPAETQAIAGLVQGGTPPEAAERELFQMSHGQVGALLARSWNFPQSLSEAMEYHHTPEMATVDPELCTFVYTGDSVAKAIVDCEDVESLLDRSLGHRQIPDEKSIEVLRATTALQVEEADSFIQVSSAI